MKIAVDLNQLKTRKFLDEISLVILHSTFGIRVYKCMQRESLKCVNIHFHFTQSIFHVNIFASLLSFDWWFGWKKSSCCLKIAAQPQHVLPQFRIVNSHHRCSITAALFRIFLQTVPVAVYMLFDHWHGEY